MHHDMDQLAHLAAREATCRRIGDEVGAAYAHDALDAAAQHIAAQEWEQVYRAALVDNKHG